MPNRPLFLSTQHGVALIEVMIAFLVLSVALIGYSALQVRAVKATQSSMQRTDASILASNILESMRANKAAAMDPLHPYALATHTCSAPGTDGSLVKNDVTSWCVSLQAAVGSASTWTARIAPSTWSGRRTVGTSREAAPRVGAPWRLHAAGHRDPG